MFGGFYFYKSLTQEERDAILLFIQADILFEGPNLIFSTGYGPDLNPNALSEQMTATIEAFSNEHGVQINPLPATGSEQLLFLYKGYTTLALWGIDPINFLNFLHSNRDCYRHISARFPGMTERTMNTYALLLEKILLKR